MRPIPTLALVAALLLPLSSVAQQTQAPAASGTHQMQSGAMQADHAVQVGDLTVSGVVARASIGNAPTSAVYMTITTAGAPDRLVAAASPAAQAVELHASLQEGGVSKMQPVEGIPVAPDAPAMLAPGGYHVMLIGLSKPLEDGATVPVTLTFEVAGEVALEVPVSKDVAGHGH